MSSFLCLYKYIINRSKLLNFIIIKINSNANIKNIVEKLNTNKLTQVLFNAMIKNKNKDNTTRIIQACTEKVSRQTVN